MCKSFADHGHSASVRAVASCEQYVATGGADDKIFVYSVKTREQLETLLHHNGTINALAFTPDAKFLLTGGSDGQIAAINVKKMKKEKVWQNAHKGETK
jgi:protein MAK11